MRSLSSGQLEKTPDLWVPQGHQQDVPADPGDGLKQESRSPFLCSSIIVVSSIFVQFLWEEMNVFVRPAKAGGAGDRNKHRGRD